MHLALSLITALAAFDGLAEAVAPEGTLRMPMTRNNAKFARNAQQQQLRKRASTVTASLVNDVQQLFYYVNVSIGTPPQNIALDIDTGSSDVWMLTAEACEDRNAICLPGFKTFDKSGSTSLTTIQEDGFEIQYETPGSEVRGDYIADNLSIGGQTIKNLTMGLATTADEVPTGILGIASNLSESIVSEEIRAQKQVKPYPNLIDLMVTQGLISSRSYSLYLDDLEASTGSVLFGGYDTDKFHGSLNVLPLQPDAQSGNISSFTVLWSSIGVTTGSKSTQLNTNSAPDVTVLDSGTSLTILPPDIYTELANYFGTQEDENGNVFVRCDMGGKTGTIDYRFGNANGPIISVPFSELAIPVTDEDGQPISEYGITYCLFGLDAQTEDEPLLFGDTFLRSAYVLYDIDAQQVGIAQASYNQTASAVTPVSAVAAQTLPGNFISQQTTIHPTTVLSPGALGGYTQVSSGRGSAGRSATPGVGGGQLTGSIVSYSTTADIAGAGAGAQSSTKNAASSFRADGKLGPAIGAFVVTLGMVSLSAAIML